MPIQSVSDTARWVAVFRAMETARPDAIFQDPYAERLAGERGRAIVAEVKHGRQMAWAMIVRTAVLDELILDRIANGGVDTVINLAVGLDTRAWRLPLPRSLQWFDVDLPEMMAYKADAMRSKTPARRRRAHRTRHHRRAADLPFPGASGVARAAVRAQTSIRWWISDIASPRLLEWMNRSCGKNVGTGTARFLFAPADSAAFFARLN